jgi:hypothetical protein
MERSLLKIALWVIGILVVIIVLSVGGTRYYRKWQQRHLMAQAQELFDKGEYKRASLNARRVMQLNEINPDAARMMAQLAERAGLRSAVDWRRRVLDLPGAQTADVLALARAALRFDEIGTVEFALGKLPEEARKTADYHAIAADLAAARRDTAEVERQLAEAAKLEPDNKTYALRLGTIRLASIDSAAAEQGRNALLELQKDSSVGKDATRILMTDALRRHEFPAAVSLARQLQSRADVTFRDRLAALDALAQASDPEYPATLAQIQKDSLQKPENVADVVSWMTVHRASTEAIAWAQGLPADVLTKKPVPLAMADAFMASSDWEGLQRLVKNAAWGDLDFLRAALSARALREMGNELDSQSQWNAAVKKASAKAESVVMLAETAQRWGWQDEAIDLLWLAAKDPLKGEAALQTLYAFFAQKGDTQNLYRVLLHLETLRPDDRNIQNNVAQISLLLNMNADRGEKLARELHEKEPANPVYASTFAFALYTQGKAQKAAEVFNALPPEKLRDPAVATYYGIVLAATGDHTRAAEFLDRSAFAKLLPEEKALVDKARRSLPQG